MLGRLSRLLCRIGLHDDRERWFRYLGFIGYGCERCGSIKRPGRKRFMPDNWSGWDA